MESISKYNFHGIEYVELNELNDLIRQMIRNYEEQIVGYIVPDEGKRIAAKGSLYHLSAVLNKERRRWDMHERLEKTRKEREAQETLALQQKRQHEKADVLNAAEKAIERTKGAVEKAEKMVKELKDKQQEKPVEQPVKPAEKIRRKVTVPCRYTVWFYGEDEETTHDSFCFVRWENQKPLFSNKPCMAMWFMEKEMAQRVADRLGDGFVVVDMWDVMTKEERLLRSIFCDDEASEDSEDYCGDGTKAEDEDWDCDDCGVECCPDCDGCADEEDE